MIELEILKQLGTTILGIILTILTFIFKGHKKNKDNTKFITKAKINDILLGWIKEAENFKNYSGTEKREYVLTRANRYSLENKIEYFEEDVKSLIEELIDFSKQVNKDKTNYYFKENKR